MDEEHVVGMLPVVSDGQEKRKARWAQTDNGLMERKSIFFVHTTYLFLLVI